MLQIKRVYEPAASTDGARVLVDRLWPRGLKKEEARLDAWLRDLAPSDGLRKWFGHEPSRFTEFQKRYERELDAEPARTLLDELARKAARGAVTLVFAAKDAEHNNAVVLARMIEGLARRGAATARRRPRSEEQAPPRRPRRGAIAASRTTATPAARLPAGARRERRASSGGSAGKKAGARPTRSSPA